MEPVDPGKDRGWWLYERGRHALVLEEAQRMLSRNPKDPDAFVLAALAHSGLERHEQAVYAAREAVALRPESAHTRYILAQVLNARVRAVNADPSARRTWKQIRATRRDVKEARQRLTEALELDPRAVYCHHFIGLFEIANHKYAKALAAAHAGLAVQPDHEGCLILASQALRKLGRIAEADAIARQGLASGPENARAHQAHGLVLLHQGRVPEAEAAFWEALRLDPTLEEAQQGLFNAVRAAGFWPYRLSLRKRLILETFTDGQQLVLGLGAVAALYLVVALTPSSSPALAGLVIGSAALLLPLGFLVDVAILPPLTTTVIWLTKRDRGLLQRYQIRSLQIALALLIAFVGLLPVLWFARAGIDAPDYLSLCYLTGWCLVFAGFAAQVGEAREPGRRRSLTVIAVAFALPSLLGIGWQRWAPGPAKEAGIGLFELLFFVIAVGGGLYNRRRRR